MLLRVTRQAVVQHNARVLVLLDSRIRHEIPHRLAVCKAELARPGRSGEARARQLDGLVRAYSSLLRAPVVGGNLSEIARQLRSSGAASGVDLVVLDCTRQLSADGQHVRDFDSVCRVLKLLAREIDSPVIFSVPVHRYACSPDGSLSLEAVPEPVEHHADLVIGIHRWAAAPSSPPTDLATLTILKNRRGPLGTATLHLDQGYLTQIGLLSMTHGSDQHRRVGQGGGATFFFVNREVRSVRRAKLA